jgi:hypothetical protein
VLRWKWGSLSPPNRRNPVNLRSLGNRNPVNLHNLAKKLSPVDHRVKARQRLIKVWAASA